MKSLKATEYKLSIGTLNYGRRNDMKKKLNYWTQLFEDGTDDTKEQIPRTQTLRALTTLKTAKRAMTPKTAPRETTKKENPKRSTPMRMSIESFRKGSRESARRRTKPRSLRT